MPTAVERLLDSFLNFDTSSEQLKLNQAFLKIDEAFLKLSNANGESLNFRKVEHDLKLHETFNVIGSSFVKLGDDFQQVATAEQLTEQFVVRLLGDHKGSDLVPAVQTDFKALELKIHATSTDLKIMGVDFIKLDSSPNAETFDHKTAILADDFVTVGRDMAADRAAFLKLAGDFLKIDEAFSGELSDIGRTFGTLADSFNKLGDALQGGGGGAGSGDNGIGGTLRVLYQQFHALDAQFVALGDGSVRLIAALASGTPSTGGTTDGPPVIVDTTHHGGGHG